MALAIGASHPPPDGRNGLKTLLVPVLGFAYLWLSATLPIATAFPISSRASVVARSEEELPKSPHDPGLWVYLGTAIALVLLGGAFAGLTIALMGQDEIYLQVIATSGEGAERKNAKTVLNLLKKGKHWVLVTLLLSNVITNETLPIVLDRSLGGGWPAVLSSTVLIVIFGEIVPQSICVRYGLPIGAWMAPLVLGLMWIMAPVAWPTAKLLDKLLGEDHGTTYKKAGLKTLVTLHKTIGTHPNERLNQDEVTIITAVLDLKDKPVGSIMTPMKDVFTLSFDTVLDEEMMDTILSAGYSRIPIYAPDNPSNFVGMLLVKMLITYDPEDALRVRDFSLATLPETRPETSCLDIVNFFQEGKSHMVLVSNFPGEPRGALGVVTLEDVIEELIGEEIIDESDVFIDVHKAIRRLQPAPRTRVPKGEVVSDHRPASTIEEEPRPDGAATPQRRTGSEPAESSMDRKLPTSFFVRRRSSGTGSLDHGNMPMMLSRDDPDFKKHLKHLGPSNAATNPKQTRISTVTIKPGIPSTIPENGTKATEGDVVMNDDAVSSGVGEGLLRSAGREASDGVHNLAIGTIGYGTFSKGSPSGDSNKDNDIHSPKSKPVDGTGSPSAKDWNHPHSIDRSHSASTIGSLHSVHSNPATTKHHGTARSGSITEHSIDVGGIRKIVLETTSSSDSDIVNDNGVLLEADSTHEDHTETEQDARAGSSDKKKRRKKRGGKKRKKGKGGDGGESTLLLGG